MFVRMVNSCLIINMKQISLFYAENVLKMRKMRKSANYADPHHRILSDALLFLCFCSASSIFKPLHYTKMFSLCFGLRESWKKKNDEKSTMCEIWLLSSCHRSNANSGQIPMCLSLEARLYSDQHATPLKHLITHSHLRGVVWAVLIEGNLTKFCEITCSVAAGQFLVTLPHQWFIWPLQSLKMGYTCC